MNGKRVNGLTDIVTFLLARIVEDEAFARLAEERRDDHLWVVTGSDTPVGVDYDPERVLADCAAKRTIVGFLDPTSATDRARPGPQAVSGGEGRYVAERVLLLLAQPFADHPEFHPPWALPVSTTS